MSAEGCGPPLPVRADGAGAGSRFDRTRPARRRRAPAHRRKEPSRGSRLPIARPPESDTISHTEPARTTSTVNSTTASARATPRRPCWGDADPAPTFVAQHKPTELLGSSSIVSSRTRVRLKPIPHGRVSGAAAIAHTNSRANGWFGYVPSSFAFCASNSASVRTPLALRPSSFAIRSAGPAAPAAAGAVAQTRTLRGSSGSTLTVTR
jgi:hypothetical protein